MITIFGRSLAFVSEITKEHMNNLARKCFKEKIIIILYSAELTIYQKKTHPASSEL
jgi:hypothetical protein